jgi:hypothetical protein
MMRSIYMYIILCICNYYIPIPSMPITKDIGITDICTKIHNEGQYLHIHT